MSPLPKPGSPGAHAIADQVHAATRELFAHLPTDEITDDEPLDLGLDDAGRFVALKTRTSVYKLRADAVFRYRVLSNGSEEVVAFKDGEQLGRFPPDEIDEEDDDAT